MTITDHRILLDNKYIGVYEKPYFIAEMSGNHNGNITDAKAIIRGAKNAGADAVKLQTTGQTLLR